jgi:glycosyltransferase involved in cell wall biosynthesis
MLYCAQEDWPGKSCRSTACQIAGTRGCDGFHEPMSNPADSGPIALPVVSVIIPTYNTADFIKETLDSVFQQTFKNVEVIVVNDGSPDTEKLESVLDPVRSQIVYLKRENHGPAAARNVAIRQAQGEYLAFLDSDDTWLPLYLEKQIEFLEKNAGIHAVYCDSRCFGDLRFSGQTFMQLCPSTGPVTLENLILIRCQVCTSCTVARRKAVLDAGLFDEDPLLRGIEDWDLWVRMVHRGSAMVYHRAVLGRRRLRPGALSSASVSMLAAQARVLRKIDSTLDVSPSMRSVIRNRLQVVEAFCELEQAKLFLACNRLGEAEEALQKANSFFRRTRLGVILLGLRTVPNLTRLGMKLWNFGLNCMALCRAAALFAQRLVIGPKNGDPV